MLDLTLRKEFQERNMPGTVVELHDGKKGAADIPAENFLELTYPTADVIRVLREASEERDGVPSILIGGKGKGKSHLLAVLHHAVKSPETTEKWLSDWSDKLHEPSWKSMKIVRGFFPITETISNHEYKTLWNLLFDRHPKGEYYKGLFAAADTPLPARSLLEKMFEEQPTCLILDEFQTWYNTLKGQQQKLAFNFIQNLSAIAKSRPDLLMFVVSFLNSESEAYSQLLRHGPMIIDFTGETAQKDRQKLILHRLFENRMQIAEADIISLTSVYAQESFRLVYSQQGTVNPQKIIDEVCACWPFAPELIDLLEDQILMTTNAQETRDMIKILAMVFKSSGNSMHVITSAAFSVEGDAGEAQKLVDAIAQEAGQEKLREIARRNLEEIRDSGVNVPLMKPMIASIWMHSMAPGNIRGIRAPQLQLSLSYNQKFNDNDFRVQLGELVDNSINIHNDLSSQNYWFEQSKNTKTEVRVAANNDRLWALNADPNGINTHPGKDIDWMMRTLRKCFIAETSQPPSDVIVLGPNWKTDPWKDVDEKEQPKNWSKLVLMVIPASFADNQQICHDLGYWLSKHVNKRRNTVRFLLQNGDKDIFSDKELMFTARCSYLCSHEAWGADNAYKVLQQEFSKPLEKELKDRFTHFAVLDRWDFDQPDNITFHVEQIDKTGIDAPDAVETIIEKNIFDLTVFNQMIETAANAGQNIGDVIDNCLEPTPGEVLPYLGEKKLLTAIQELAANGKIAMNLDSTWHARKAGQSTDEARAFIRNKTTRSGGELRKILLGPVSAAGGGAVVSPVPAPPPQPMPPPLPPQPIVTITGGGTTQPVPLPPIIPVEPTPKEKTLHADPTNGVTLVGNFEKWGLKPSSKLKTASIRLDGVTVQMLKSFIQRLPSTCKAALDISYDEEKADE